MIRANSKQSDETKVVLKHDEIAGKDFRRFDQIYEGECVHGVKHGKGTLIFKYHDDIHQTLRDEIIALTQKKYIGEFQNDLPNGYGTMIYENGLKFVGYFIDGVRQGLGMELDNTHDGPVNKGMFLGDQRVGPNWVKNID